MRACVGTTCTSRTSPAWSFSLAALKPAQHHDRVPARVILLSGRCGTPCTTRWWRRQNSRLLPFRSLRRPEMGRAAYFRFSAFIYGTASAREQWPPLSPSSSTRLVRVRDPRVRSDWIFSRSRHGLRYNTYIYIFALGGWGRAACGVPVHALYALDAHEDCRIVVFVFYYVSDSIY